MYWWYEDRSFGDELFSFFLFEIFNSADVCFCLRLRCCSTFFVAEVHVFDGVLKMYFAALKVILTNQVINSLDNDFYKRIEYKEDWWLLHILVMPLNMFHLVIESTILIFGEPHGESLVNIDRKYLILLLCEIVFFFFYYF